MLKADGEEIGSIGIPYKNIKAPANEPVPVRIEYLVIGNILGDDVSALNWIANWIKELRQTEPNRRFFSSLPAALAALISVDYKKEGYSRIILIVNDKPFWVVWRAS